MSRTAQPIAIVGYAFRFPPDSEDDETFWEILEQGRNVATEWPESRANLDSFWSNDPEHESKLLARKAHFCSQDPGTFDAPFFTITAKEAASMDPQQRWLLETSYRAFESAGIPVSNLAGSPIGVFAASMTDDYARLISCDPDNALPNTSTGNNASILANRLSWYYDLRGPSLAVNTACSGSMVATHLACKSLQSGECCAALVGGATALLSVETSMHMSAMNFLSPDGLCHSFDAQANGYSRGEGVSVMILKRLHDAVHDGDTIRAVIRGTGTNQDGHTPGITLPNSVAQESLIRQVYSAAGLTLDNTRYIEAHGTGTQAGDATEVNALGRVFGSHRSGSEPLYVGSVKSNIGHLEGASALAGILRASLILERGIIPPQAMFQTMNPKIKADFYNIQVPTRCIPWPTSGLRRISINSFGFGGTNAHMILDDAYHTLENLSLKGVVNTRVIRHSYEGVISQDTSMLRTDDCTVEAIEPVSILSLPSVGFQESSGDEELSQIGASSIPEDHPSAHLYVFSARDEAALSRSLDAQSLYYDRNIVDSATAIKSRYAYLLSERRETMPWRTFAVSHKSSGSHLSFAPSVRASAVPRISFVFTGQGAQYAGMGRELLRFDVFKKTMMQTAKVYREQGASWDILDALDKAEQIDRPEFSQPLCTALQIALVKLLRSWNILPAAVVGHSSGEIAAAFAADMITLESACRIAYHRGRLAGALAKESSDGMLSVNLSEDAMLPYLERLDLLEKVHLACFNSPTNITLSGGENDLDLVKAKLDEEGIFTQKLRTGAAYHSPSMASMASEYEVSIGPITSETRPTSSAVMISTVSGNFVTPATVRQPHYWVENLVSPVRFADALRYLTVEAPNDNANFAVHKILEIGPHATLRRPIDNILTSVEVRLPYHSLLSRFDSAVKTSIEVAGHLWTKGVPVDVAGVNQVDEVVKSGPALVDMPAYPFNRSQQYWHESRISRDWRLRGPAPRDILGIRASDFNPLQPRWRKMLSLETDPWLADHVIGNDVVYPGVGSLLMALEAVRQNADPNKKISGLFVKKAMFMAPVMVKSGIEGHAELVTQLCPLHNSLEKTSRRSEVQIFSVRGGKWQQSFQGNIEIEYETSSSNGVDAGRESHAEVERLSQRWRELNESCKKPITKRNFYSCTANSGIRYDEMFQLAEDFRWDGSFNSASRIPVDVHENESASAIRLATLDAAFQTIYVAPSKGAMSHIPTFIPHAMHNLWLAEAVWQRLGYTGMRVATVSRPKKGLTGLDCEVIAVDDDGLPLLHLPKLELLPVLSEKEEHGASRSLLRGIEWKPALSLLSSPQLNDMFAAKDSAEENEKNSQYMRELNRTVGTMLRSLLSEIRQRDIIALFPHHKRYLSWLENQVVRLGPGPTLPPGDLNNENNLSNLKTVHKRFVEEVLLRLPNVVTGEVDPLEVLFSTDLATEAYDYMFAESCGALFHQYIGLFSHQFPSMRILEVGAGTGGFTSHVHSILKQREEITGGLSFVEYTFTDISPSFFDSAQQKFAGFGERVKFQVVDIESDLISQGVEEASYDVIFAGSVVHATRNLSRTLTNLRKALKLGGKLILQELTQIPNLLLDCAIFGLLPGWWLGEEEFRSEGPLLSLPEWDEVLRENGFSGNDLVLKDHGADEAHVYSIIVTTASADEQGKHENSPSVIYVIDETNPEQRAVANALAAETFKARSHRIIVPFKNLYDGSAVKAEYVVLLVELGNPFLMEIGADDFVNLKRLTQHWRNLLWVTTASDSALAPYEGVKDGFLRVLRSEAEHKRIASLTLESWDSAANHIDQVFQAVCNDKVFELEFTVTGDKLCIPRLITETKLNDDLHALLQPRHTVAPWLPSPPLKVDILHHGSLETLHFSEDMSYYDPLKDDEVEVETKAMDVNFRDVFIALGRLEDDTFGGHAGIVTRVGSGVRDFKEGDRVVMLSPGAMRMYGRSPGWCSKIPDNMSFEEAVSILNPAVCAYFSLIEVARLQKDEKVLIHAAAGGVGQAAVMIAQMLGAEIFCAVGNREKKNILMTHFGIEEDHIFYSRNTSFKQGVLRLTDGRGVDVVLNSLVGDSLRASFECLAPFGRFIELGKADIKSNAQLPMEGFLNSVTFTAIDITQVATLRPQVRKRVLDAVMELAETSVIRSPQPLHVYGLEQIEEAFRYFQSGRNTGRTVITVRSDAVVNKRLLSRKTWRFDPNASYIIAGGMGGIGRSIMKWMAGRGARNIIVPSRSSRSATTMKAAMELIKELRSKGVRIESPRCDVACAVTLRTVLHECSKTMPPVRGCINAAMLLQDSVFENMTHRQWKQTIDSKVATTWNLHSQLPSNLDFFIMLSSIAGVIGTPGQSNYAAGCTFQDSLCRQRVKQGQKAIAIDLGVMRTIGIVAETGRLQKSYAESRGMPKIEESEFLALLDMCCDPKLPVQSPDKSQVVMGIATPADLQAAGDEPHDQLNRPLFANFAHSAGSTQSSTSTQANDYVARFRKAAVYEQRMTIVVEALVSKLARALSIGTDEVDPSKPLHVFGVDSLVAIELRNWIANEFGVDVAVFDIMGSSSIAGLGSKVAQRSGD